MKVSIIMPTYNDALHISSSIQSVIEQTHSDWELLIMDDGSHDNTHSVVLNFQDNRIHYFQQENQGQLVALNNLCSYITGEIVLMLHSDDRLYNQNTLEINLKHFTDPETDGLYGDFHQFFDSGKPGKIVPAPKRMNKSAVYKLATLLGSNIIIDHFFVRRSVFEKYVLYNYLTYYMPYWLNFKKDTVTCLNLKYTSYPWYHYRVYDNNYTNSIIGNFEVYFTRFRSIFFLSEFITIPFPLLQKELMRRLHIQGPVCKKRASNLHLSHCFEANIRSMIKRTPGAYTSYFEKLTLFYKSNSTRELKLESTITTEYKASEARRFFSDLQNGTLPPLTSEIINNLTEGFSKIIVNNEDEKNKLKELLLFLCIRSIITLK